MRRRTGVSFLTAFVVMAGGVWLQGCTGHVPGGPAATEKVAANSAERTCLIRAMYFESNRSSHDGLMAVGTVVMNRVASPLYPNTICGVVGEARQFAPGVLTRTLNAKELPPIERAADAVLKGERYAPVGGAMHFHVAGLNIPYRVRYVAMAGGNAFYLKVGGRSGDRRLASERAANVAVPPSKSETQQTALADAAPQPTLIERLYASLAGTQNSKTCATASSVFGATSLACEDGRAAR